MRISEVLGKSIISADTGENVGRVDEILLDSARHQIVGILVTAGVLSRQQVLPFDEVQTVGADAVIVKTVTTMRDAKEWVREGQPANRWHTVHGKQVVTAQGASIGTIHDVVVDQRGHLTALDIAVGRHGTRHLRPTLVHGIDQIELTNEVVVVPDSVASTRSTE